jgi:hypothetical protein
MRLAFDEGFHRFVTVGSFGTQVRKPSHHYYWIQLDGRLTVRISDSPLFFLLLLLKFKANNRYPLVACRDLREANELSPQSLSANNNEFTSTTSNGRRDVSQHPALGSETRHL